jgi:DNA-binding transcriptional LysR family regulator
MNEIDLGRVDLNLLVTFDVLMSEGSVTRAAARLGRTQSAVSHSLARLREQVGDPLLVKLGNGMAPSPFAQRLIDDVRPILRSIRRAIAPPEPFDPATSRRVFRVAIADFVPTLLPRVIADVQQRAPGVAVEWMAPNVQTMTAIAESQLDIALVASTVVLPEGVQQQTAGDAQPLTLARKGHPAIASWGAPEWTRWPHIQVQLGERIRGEVERAVTEQGLTRTIGATIPNFSQIPALLARTNLLATMTPLVVNGDLDAFGLVALEPPVPIRPTTFCFVWSFRLANDPGSRWFRERVMEAFAGLQREVAAKVAGLPLVRVKAGRRSPAKRRRKP